MFVNTIGTVNVMRITDRQWIVSKACTGCIDYVQSLGTEHIQYHGGSREEARPRNCSKPDKSSLKHEKCTRTYWEIIHLRFNMIIEAYLSEFSAVFAAKYRDSDAPRRIPRNSSISLWAAAKSSYNINNLNFLYKNSLIEF